MTELREVPDFGELKGKRAEFQKGRSRSASRRSKRASGLGPNDRGAGFIISAELHVTLPGADVEAAKGVVRGAHTICPYSNATRNNIDVKLSVTPADGKDYDVT